MASLGMECNFSDRPRKGDLDHDLYQTENNSDGSGSKFFGFGLRSGMRFRVGFFRVSIAKQVSGLIGFGFKVKINFRVLGFSGFKKIKF